MSARAALSHTGVTPCPPFLLCSDDAYCVQETDAEGTSRPLANRKTKIICTLGAATSSADAIERLVGVTSAYAASGCQFTIARCVC
jgi:hypothetical protein